MQHLKWLLLYCTFIFINGCSQEKTNIKDPNFLVIVVDDLGYMDLSCMGSKYYETPNIDRIASNGMIFTNGYAACAVCSPSRASLLTGKFPARHGITDYIGAPTGVDWRKTKRHTKLLPAEYVHHLNKESITLPEAMKENGYATFFTGKWHLGSEKEKSLPTDHGFDINKGGYHVGGPYSGGYFSPFNNPYLKDLKTERGISLSMKLAKETSNFIKQNKNSKFLAYLSFYAVHGPIQTSKNKWMKYRNKADSMGIHENGFEMERVLPIRKYQDNPVYAGLVEQVDDAVGSVLETLKELDLDKNTIVIFTSDNGGVASGDNFSTSISPLRGGKGYQWEGGIKVPYFIHIPWKNYNGSKNDTPVSGVDLYPTILELAGLASKPNEHKDGISLAPLLGGKNIPSRPLYWHYPHYGNQGGEPHSIIRNDNWKLIHYWEDGHDELYNLNIDTGERNDLSNVEQGITDKLRANLMNWLIEMNAKYPVIDSLQDEVEKRLVLERYKTKLWSKLEKERQEMLQTNWEPNQDWWGSSVSEE